MKNLYKVAAEKKFRGVFKNAETADYSAEDLYGELEGQTISIGGLNIDLSFLANFAGAATLKGLYNDLDNEVDDTLNKTETTEERGAENPAKNSPDNGYNSTKYSEFIEKIKNINSSKNEKVVKFAEKVVKEGDNLNAEHCTDWVSKVYGAMGLIPNANAGIMLFNGNLQKKNGKLVPEKIAGPNIINSIPIGCNIVVENGNSSTGTHELFVKENLGNGRLLVMSLPNSNGKPKTEVYNLNSGLDPYTNKKTSNGDRVGNLCRVRMPPNKLK